MHNISNHIMQSILVSPSMTKEVLEIMFKQLETTTMCDEDNNNCLKYCIKNRYRRGVFYKLCCVCVQYQICGDKLIQCIQSFFYHEKNSEDGTKQKKKKYRLASIQSCIPKLLFNSSLDKTIDGNAARIINTLLLFYETYPKLVIDIIDGIINDLTIKELDAVIKDGTISRYLIDGILDHPQKNEKDISSYTQKLYKKLKGKWIYYAIDRIGKHTVLKLYSLLKYDNQLSLVQELAESYNRLQGCNIGKHISKELGIDEFITNGEHYWKQKYLKSSSDCKKRFIQEVDSGKKKKRKKEVLVDGIHNDGGDEKIIKNENDYDSDKKEKDAVDHDSASRKKKKKKKKKHD